MAICRYRCDSCKTVIEAEEDDIEDVLWSHLEKKHPYIFEDDQGLRNADMIEKNYEKV